MGGPPSVPFWLFPSADVIALPARPPRRRRRRSRSRRRRCRSRHCLCASACYLPSRCAPGGSHGDSCGAWASGCFPAPLAYGRPSANTALPSCYHSSIARSAYLPPPFATPVSLPRIVLVLVHAASLLQLSERGPISAGAPSQGHPSLAHFGPRPAHARLLRPSPRCSSTGAFLSCYRSLLHECWYLCLGHEPRDP